MSRQGIFTEYNGLTIFEKDGTFTVGSDTNCCFDDCTLENLEHGRKNRINFYMGIIYSSAFCYRTIYFCRNRT